MLEVIAQFSLEARRLHTFTFNEVGAMLRTVTKRTELESKEAEARSYLNCLFYKPFTA
jgi:hypothetical protein